ncbi:hypothetical protein CYY_008078 [Polysphondylium violaceum]|uniref:Transmembrane protein n=1 Tax=Polysphondylium violaceum TaxID=133409 RepID=A0A8J4PM80_9MYCE|nr:hypothetical protein CYY_008078 [Polysphondylium violaceum]
MSGLPKAFGFGGKPSQEDQDNKNDNSYINFNNHPSKDSRNKENHKNMKKKQRQQKPSFQLSSLPTYSTGAFFLFTSVIYSHQKKPMMMKVSGVSAIAFCLSGYIIDQGYDKVGPILAGGLAAFLGGSSLANGLSKKKLFPLFISSVSIASMSYHGFYSLYNSLDTVKSAIDQHDKKVKQIRRKDPNASWFTDFDFLSKTLTKDGDKKSTSSSSSPPSSSLSNNKTNSPNSES